jgi:predicted nucleic acid-binding protein
MIYFLDASAVVKRYVREAGSGWVRALTNAAGEHHIVLAEITLAEVAAALAARERAPDGINRRQRDELLTAFLTDCQRPFHLRAVSRTVIDSAVHLTQRHRLRGYDAVQLATALAVNDVLLTAQLPGLIFVAADGDLVNAARAEGLAAENPNDYP